MRIVVIKSKIFVRILIILIAVVGILVVLGISQSDVLGVFSTDKDLPIYYVDCPDKKVAITFDCAWGAGN